MATEPQTQSKQQQKDQSRNPNRTVFDSQMIQAATHQKNHIVTIFLSNGEIVVCSPVTVDKYFLLVEIRSEEDENVLTGEEMWIGKEHIVTARVEKTQ